VLSFEDAKRRICNAMNQEACMQHDIHHLVKSSLLKDSELSHLLDAQSGTRYDETLLQSLLDKVPSS
jgi:hypothetical protein